MRLESALTSARTLPERHRGRRGQDRHARHGRDRARRGRAPSEPPGHQPAGPRVLGFEFGLLRIFRFLLPGTPISPQKLDALFYYALFYVYFQVH